MERREFLVMLAEGLLASTALAALAGCGGSSSTSSSSGFDVVSSLADGHAHIVTIRLADLASPPAGGVLYTTGSFGGHTHRLALSQDELAALQSGQTVTEVTTTDAGHAHSFTIKKP